MFSSDLFPNDLYSLWNDNQQSHHKKLDKNLFAPPLSAYSSDLPGASRYHLEYTITSSSKNSRLFTNTPLTQSKQSQLAKIRNTGYTTIRPIGIIQTLEEVDLDKNYYNNNPNDSEDPASAAAAAAIENSSDAVLGMDGSTLSIHQQLMPQEDVDLDAQILNVDDMYSESDDDDDENSGGDLINEPEENSLRARVGVTMDDEGFMAAEIDLNSETHNGMLMNSGSTSTIFNSNVNTGRTLTTNPTTTASGSLMPINEQNENDYSEQDMVVD
ncbi:hypothetical protein SBY92_003975 [Candida maltosa Xu316]